MLPLPSNIAKTIVHDPSPIPYSDLIQTVSMDFSSAKSTPVRRRPHEAGDHTSRVDHSNSRGAHTGRDAVPASRRGQQINERQIFPTKHYIPRRQLDVDPRSQGRTPQNIDGDDPEQVRTNARQPGRKPTLHEPPREHICLTVHPSSTVALGDGFEVLDVLTASETPWVIIGNVPPSTTDGDVLRLFEPFAPPLQVSRRSNAWPPTNEVSVRLPTAAIATQASSALNGAKALGVIITARQPISNLSRPVVLVDDTAVAIQWQAPGKTAFGAYRNVDHAHRAIEVARTQSFGYSFAKAEIYQGLPAVGEVTVRFQGIPSRAGTSDMEKFAAPSDVMWTRPNYRSLWLSKRAIRKFLNNIGGLVSFEVMDPPYPQATVRSVARFATVQQARRACARLHGARPQATGKTVILAQHLHSLTYDIDQQAFQKVQPEVIAFRGRVARQTSTPSVFLSPPCPPTNAVTITLLSHNVGELRHLKVQLEEILSGETLRRAGRCVWDDSLIQPAGHSFLSRIRREHPTVTVEPNHGLKRVTIFGSSISRKIVGQAIVSAIASLQQQKAHAIPFHVGMLGKDEIEELERAVGQGNAVRDARTRTLIVLAGEAGLEAAQKWASSVQQRRQPSGHQWGVCPVCFDLASPPVSLPCGHTWCRSCLRGFLEAAAEQQRFPVSCIGPNPLCKQPIPLSIALDVLPAESLDALARYAFSSHVQTRPQAFRHCPKPDCPQVHRTGGRGTVIRCPSCLTRICPSCNVEEHEGFDCTDANGGDFRFRKWVTEHDVKRCPGCRTIIERSEGCNHMICTQCKAHICWVCCQQFPDGQSVYSHLRASHQGATLA